MKQLLKFYGLSELFGFRNYAMTELQVSSIKSQCVKQAFNVMVQYDRCEWLASDLWRRIVNWPRGLTTKLRPQ